MKKCQSCSHNVWKAWQKKARYATTFLLPLLTSMHSIEANTAFSKRACLWIATALVVCTTHAGQQAPLHGEPCTPDAFAPSQEKIFHAEKGDALAPCMRVADEAYPPHNVVSAPKEKMLRKEAPLVFQKAPVAALHNRKKLFHDLLPAISSHLFAPAQTEEIRWKDNEGRYLEDSNDLSTDAIIGIVFASFFCLCLSACCCYYYWLRDILIDYNIVSKPQDGYNEEVPTDINAVIYTNENSEMTVLATKEPSELEE